MKQTVIYNGTIIDGSGSDPWSGEILIENDTIVELGAPGSFEQTNRRAFNAHQAVVAPGFIDVHSHADNAALLERADISKISQGVTTEIVGNCGHSLFPLDPIHRADQIDSLEQTFPPLTWEWQTYADFVDVINKRHLVTNQAHLVGHNTLRLSVGADYGEVDGAQLQIMQQRLSELVNSGAIGLSTGLIYSPAINATSTELTHLAQVLRESGIYTSHMRNESFDLLNSIEETVKLARDSGARTHVSHLKASGPKNWGKVTEALRILDHARADGLAIKQDIYPYTASSTMLSAILPPEVREGSVQEIVSRLRSPEIKSAIRRQFEKSDTEWESPVHESGWEGITIASTSTGNYEGMSLLDVARLHNTDPLSATLRLLETNDLKVTMLQESMSENDIEAALLNPHTMIGSDGLPPREGGKPHPRQWGTFPRVLSRYVREKNVLPLAEAVRKMTSLSAQWFGLDRRGVIESGASADLVIFDPETVKDTATYKDPETQANGISTVFVNGEIAYEHGRLTRQVGRVLKARKVTS